MAIVFSLTSSSKGDIFTSTEHQFESGIIPTTPFGKTRSQEHLEKLWKEHLKELTEQKLYEPVLGALSDLAGGAVGVASTETRGQIRDLLRNNPPNLNILRSVKQPICGLHICRPDLWPFICLSEDIVNPWITAVIATNKKNVPPKVVAKELALRALIKTTIDHELGHWMFTLRVGHFNDNHLTLADDDEDSNTSYTTKTGLKRLPSNQFQNDINKHTSKTMRAAWRPVDSKTGVGEAGNFVENRSRGGLLEVVGSDAFMHTARGKFKLPSDYLAVYGSSPAQRTLMYKPHQPKSSNVKKSSSATKKKDSTFYPATSDPPETTTTGTSLPGKVLGYRDRLALLHKLAQEVLQERENACSASGSRKRRRIDEPAEQEDGSASEHIDELEGHEDGSAYNSASHLDELEGCASDSGEQP